ncbi:exodeoxyribonuclease III [Bacillus suaedae]|uniref:Exodeoxyribonuclease III n=1 Tax=Halalkalibacter suaedae TaxID=2822140 RepID=A0A941APS1_9BACI|nr:exodeoxyribonuclease III [Bacillus suaedae]MBP3950413.1 exodeoxyribonuclease III [Bacillus suaedae]
MKYVSWNVNGLRACLKKGFLSFFERMDADVFCVQETKLQPGQLDLTLEGYYDFWNFSKIKKGYSGTAIFTKQKPISVSYGLDETDEDLEGRLITLEFDSYYFVCAYVPNSQRDLARLTYRLEWEDRLRDYLARLKMEKEVIYCGDLNVAHEAIDLRNPKSNKGNSGFTEEEREKMSILLGEGFIDSYRFLYPDKEFAYTWWSYMNTVRERNIGWRIDYFIVSNGLSENIADSYMECDVLGSDHCPIVLELK